MSKIGNKYNFLANDLVVVFKTPLPLKETFKWFQKNSLNKNGISFEFACDKGDANVWQEKAKPRSEMKLEKYKDEDQLFKQQDRENLVIRAVALYGRSLEKRLKFTNVIKSKYKIDYVGYVKEAC